MRKIVKVISMAMLLVMCFSTTAFAAETETAAPASNCTTGESTKNAVTETLSEPQSALYGAKPPSGDSFINIVNNNYNFSVNSMTVGLYTNTFFKGSTSVLVTVGNINVNKNGMQNESKGITVHLRKKGTSLDVKYSVPLTGTSFYFNNLDSSAMYYLEFTKQNDSQIYSFSGTIKNGN